MKLVKEKTKMKKLLIIFAVLCLAAPAMAADWNFYGSGRMTTFWSDVDPDTTGADSDLDLNHTIQTNARIGANVKVNDQIGGKFEYGTSGGNANLRLLYGTYTFGNGSQLLVGQSYTPTSGYFYSNSVFDDDGDLLGVGQFYVGRKPMVQWSMGGFKVALVQPNTEDELGKPFKAELIEEIADDLGLTDEEAEDILGIIDEIDFDAAASAAGADLDVTLPKIEANYKFKSDMFFIDVFGGYQTYEIEFENQTWDVDSYVVGLGGGVNFGAFFLNAGVHMGQNLGNYGAYNPVGIADDAGYTDTGGTLDNDGLGYLAVLGFNASEMFTIEVGYGYEEAEVDNSNDKQQATQYYLNSTINIAPGFFIVPEVGYIEKETDQNTATPNTTYYGLKWQINF
jgi:hypothetical protein